MATTAKIANTNKKPKFSTQHRNRCSICGRPRAFLRKFGLCRLCIRGLALKGEIPGVSGKILVDLGRQIKARQTSQEPMAKSQ